jgi:hypothetical protein
MRLLICILAFASTAAWAQDKPAAKQAAKPAVAVEKSATVAAPAAADKPAPVAKKSRRAEDARHCLEKTSNNEVIKCAEAYL